MLEMLANSKEFGPTVFLICVAIAFATVALKSFMNHIHRTEVRFDTKDKDHRDERRESIDRYDSITDKLVGSIDKNTQSLERLSYQSRKPDSR